MRYSIIHQELQEQIENYKAKFMADLSSREINTGKLHVLFVGQMNDAKFFKCKTKGSLVIT